VTRHRRPGPPFASSPTSAVFVALSIAAVAALTLDPGSSVSESGDVLCLFCGDRAIADAILNVILYLPVGASLAGIGLPPRRVVLVGAALSAGIEFVQIALPGRDASIGDLLTNTTGTLLGALAAGRWRLWVTPPDRVARRLATLWSGLAALILVAPGWLFRPAPTDSEYYAHLNPQLGYIGRYPGTVLTATLGGHPFIRFRGVNGAPYRAAIERGDTLAVRFVVARPPERLAGIAGLWDGDQWENVLLAVDGNDIVLRYRMRAVDWKLDWPDVRLRGALSGRAPGDTAHVSAWRRGAEICIAVDEAERCGLGFTAATGWAALYYPEPGPIAAVALGWAWVAAVAFPLGLWGRGRTGAATLLVLIGVTALPGSLGMLRPAPLVAWLGLACGFGAGALARRWARGLVAAVSGGASRPGHSGTPAARLDAT
jgi:hypothetical protein